MSLLLCTSETCRRHPRMSVDRGRPEVTGRLQSRRFCRISPPSWSARMNSPSGLLIAILPCNDLDASERFYNRLGFARPDSQRPARGEPDTYRMLSNGKGGYYI